YGLSHDNIANPLATPATSTLYRVYVVNEYDCRDTLEVFVDVYPLAILSIPDSVVVYPGEPYHVEPSTNAHYFSWYPPAGISNTEIADPYLSPDVPTRYFVRATTEYGCEVIDSIDVLVSETIWDMPNAFHPGSEYSNRFKVSK